MQRMMVAAILLGWTAGSALAAGDGYSPPDMMKEWGPATPQPGYIQFCDDYYDGECGPFPKDKGRIQLTEEMREELEEVNFLVNRMVAPATDMQLWGVEDHWSYPVHKNGGLYGDCEDYVLEKRRILMEMGWPAHALLITVVFDENDGGHAILTVATEEGDLILDNLHPEIRYWHETPYRFVKRQSEANPNAWASLRRGRPSEHDVPVAGAE